MSSRKKVSSRTIALLGLAVLGQIGLSSQANAASSHASHDSDHTNHADENHGDASDGHVAPGSAHDDATSGDSHETQVPAAQTDPLAMAGEESVADVIISKLKEGNARFVAGESTFPHLDEARRCEAFVDGQKPQVSVLSCADSRVPVELIFDAGIGDLFVVRVAGNVADTDEIATIEYGAGHLNTPVIVVMGHSHCGAVKAVTQGAKLGGALPKLVDNIIAPATLAKTELKGYPLEQVVSRAVKYNVRQSQSDLLTKSDEIRELVKHGKVKVVGAVYDIHTGAVQWLGEHPGQLALLQGESPKHEAPSAPKLRKPITTASAMPAAHGSSSSDDSHASADSHGASDAHAPKRAQTVDLHDDEHGEAASKSKKGHEDSHDSHDAPAKDGHVSAVAKQGLMLPIAMGLGAAALSGGAVYFITGRKKAPKAHAEAHAEDSHDSAKH